VGLSEPPFRVVRHSPPDVKPLLLSLEVMQYLEEKTLSDRITVRHSRGAFKTNKKKCDTAAMLISAVVDDAFAEAVVLPWFKKWKERKGLLEWKLRKKEHIEGKLTLILPLTELQSKDMSRILGWGREYSYLQIKHQTPRRMLFQLEREWIR